MKVHKGRTKGGQRHIQMLDSKPGKLDARKRLTATESRMCLGRSLDEMRRAFGLSIPQVASQLGWTTGLLVSLIEGKLSPSDGQHADLSRWAKERRAEKEKEEAAQ